MTDEINIAVHKMEETIVSFQEQSAFELLLELTQEQQETVSGGAYTETTEETKDSYYKKYEYSENTVEEGKEENPLYRPLSNFRSILGTSMMPSLSNMMPRIRI
jgi:hypothetical protein